MPLTSLEINAMRNKIKCAPSSLVEMGNLLS